MLNRKAHRGDGNAKSQTPPSEVANSYTPTPCELKALKAAGPRWSKANPAPRVNVTEVAGAKQIGVDHPDRVVGQMLLMGALGTCDGDFYNGLIGQLANIASRGQKVDERDLNFTVSIVKGIGPKDQIETMLAAQMAAVHNATMTFARRLNHVENIAQQDVAERTFNKLARTFAVQVEALKRYRTGGEQRVTVQHVNVGNGGQAIVGQVANLPAERGGDEITGGQSHALADTRGSEVLCDVQAERGTLPRSRGQR